MASRGKNGFGVRDSIKSRGSGGSSIGNAKLLQKRAAASRRATAREVAAASIPPPVASAEYDMASDSSEDDLPLPPPPAPAAAPAPTWTPSAPTPVRSATRSARSGSGQGRGSTRKAVSSSGDGVSGSKYSAKRVKPEVGKIVFNQNTGMMELEPPKSELNQKNKVFRRYRSTLLNSAWFSKKPSDLRAVYNDASISKPTSLKRKFRKSRRKIMTSPAYYAARPLLKAKVDEMKREGAKIKGKGLSNRELYDKGYKLFNMPQNRSAAGNKLRHNYKAKIVRENAAARTAASKARQAEYKKALSEGRGSGFKIGRNPIGAVDIPYEGVYPANIRSVYNRYL